MRNFIRNYKYYVIGFIVFLLFLIIPLSVTTINSGEVGIRVRFGKVIEKRTQEGINFTIPFVEKIAKMNVKVQKTEVKTSSSSKDLQEVDMSIAVNYRIDSDRAIELYKTVGTGYETIILEPAIEESIKAVTSKYTAE